MTLCDPYAAYNAASNLEAHIVCNILREAGLEALAIEDVSTGEAVTRPQVWIERADAERRLRELRERGATVIYGDVLQDMKERDARDSGRRVAPLAAAPDAVTIDTTGLNADQVFELASGIIERALAAHGISPR